MARDPGTVYLLHFDRPYGPGGGANGRGTAKHYLGWAKHLEQRLAHHADGSGANLLRVIKQAGIGWTLARTWTGDRHRERQLKQQGGRSRMCPVCKEAKKSEDSAMSHDHTSERDGSWSESVPDMSQGGDGDKRRAIREASQAQRTAGSGRTRAEARIARPRAEQGLFYAHVDVTPASSELRQAQAEAELEAGE